MARVLPWSVNQRVPAVLTRPIARPVPESVNQRLPSGPGVIANGLSVLVRAVENSVMEGVIALAVPAKASTTSAPTRQIPASDRTASKYARERSGFVEVVPDGLEVGAAGVAMPLRGDDLATEQRHESHAVVAAAVGAVWRGHRRSSGVQPAQSSGSGRASRG